MLKKIVIIGLLVLVILESFLLFWVLSQYSQGFFIKQYFNEITGETKTSYYLGNIFLWEERTEFLRKDQSHWQLVHIGGRVCTQGGEKSFVYWKKIDMLIFFMSSEEIRKIKIKYLELLGQNPEKAYEYVDKYFSDIHKYVLIMRSRQSRLNASDSEK